MSFHTALEMWTFVFPLFCFEKCNHKISLWHEYIIHTTRLVLALTRCAIQQERRVLTWHTNNCYRCDASSKNQEYHMHYFLKTFKNERSSHNIKIVSNLLDLIDCGWFKVQFWCTGFSTCPVTKCIAFHLSQLLTKSNSKVKVTVSILQPATK